MGRPPRKSEETKFLRGEIGADGQRIEPEEQDPEELDRAKAKAELVRSHTFLGREFLTWLLWRSRGGDALVQIEREPVTALFIGRIVLRGLAGEATEVAVKGALSPYSELVRLSIDRGLLVHAARLRLEHGEKSYEVTLDAEHLDFRGGRIPALLSEAEDDRLQERLFLMEQLEGIVDRLLERFLSERAAKTWRSTTVKSIREWLREG
jgi:hypothetical protein